MVQEGYFKLLKVCATPRRTVPHRSCTALRFTQETMSALAPNSTFFDEWPSLPPYIDEEMSTIAQILVDHPHHSPGTTSSPQGSVSSSATTINTPQSASSGPTALHSAGINSIGQHESNGPEHQEYFSEHSLNNFGVFTASPQIVTAKSSRANMYDFLPDLDLDHLDPLLSENVQNLFPERYDPETTPIQLDSFENHADLSCHPDMLRPEPGPQQYQNCTPQASAEPWGPPGGLPVYGQARNHYIVHDFSIDRWDGNLGNESLFQLAQQYPTSSSFHIPVESPLNIVLNGIDKEEIIEKNPSNFPSTRAPVTTSLEDFQTQPARARQPLLERGFRRPITTKVNSQNSPKERHKDHKNIVESGLIARRQRSTCRGAFTDPVQRLETGETRKLGACLRCKMQRIRVRPSNVES